MELTLQGRIEEEREQSIIAQVSPARVSEASRHDSKDDTDFGGLG